jgi:glutamate/tyrosine decarboxylase-like PLP-dependent enzyme
MTADAANVVPFSIRPIQALFCTPKEREKWDDFLTVALGDARVRVAKGRVGPDADMELFRAALGAFDFQSPRPLSEVMPWIIGQLEHGMVQLTHPRYFGLFNPCPTLPAECADRIVAAFNPQLATSTTSPIPVEIEAHVVRAIAERVGFPAEAAGHFATGGSEANFTALICALTNACPLYGAGGIRAFERAPVVYVSEDSHLAWCKIAHHSGIGRAAMRLVDADEHGRMDLGALAAAVADDQAAGRLPAMIVATAGTTGAGMIDPLVGCAEIARRCGAWFHVDAAWGGAVIVSERLRGLLAGIEAADSVTIDAHKWFATTMSCGIFITRHAAILSDTFHATTNYMPSNLAGVDPYVTTVQWSRRFLGLRLFLSLATAGWRGYGEHVERSVALAEMLKAELGAQGWRIANDSGMAVICAEPPEGFPHPQSIARDVVASGAAWVSSTVFRGRHVVRMCLTNGHTMPEDVQSLARLLQDFEPAAVSKPRH